MRARPSCRILPCCQIRTDLRVDLAQGSGSMSSPGCSCRTERHSTRFLRMVLCGPSPTSAEIRLDRRSRSSSSAFQWMCGYPCVSKWTEVSALVRQVKNHSRQRSPSPNRVPLTGAGAICERENP